MYELNVTTHFAAAHRLREYEGKCENLHGHNWRVDVVVASDTLDSRGLVMDFKELKAVLADILEALDHKYLNEVPPFDSENPTTENLARFLCEELRQRLPEGVRASRVTCWESEMCGATYIA